MKQLERIRQAVSSLWDWFTLFCGISTSSGLERTQGRPVRTRGIFLFRSGKTK